MQAGFSRQTINPPLGSPMQGLWQQGGCTAVREDIYVQVLYLESSGTTCVIIGCDLLFFDRPVADRVRKAVAMAVDVNMDHVLLNFSHNHAGPVTGTWGYQQTPDPAYLAKVELAMVKAAQAAWAKAVPVHVSTGMTHCPLPVSRRFVGDDGQVQWRPARDAEICDAVPVCELRNEQGNIICLLYSASCHPSTWYAPETCGDYPGVANRLLNERFDTEGAIFLQGCAGDSKPCTIAREDAWAVGTWGEVEAAGRMLADAVAAKIDDGLAPCEPKLTGRMLEINFPLESVPDENQLRAILADPEQRTEKQDWGREMLDRLLNEGRLPASVPVRLQVLELADTLRLVALECEPVGEIGNMILRIFGDGVTFPLGYSNGTQLYLPTDHMLPEHGYEVDSYWEYHWPAPLASGIDQALENALLEQKQKIIK